VKRSGEWRAEIGIAGVSMAFCAIEPERLSVPAPERFRMGSRGSDAREEPAHWVVIRRPAAGVPPFWLAETPVTQAQLAVWTDSSDYADWFARHREELELREVHSSSFPGKPEYPAEQVTWWEALAFCDWLTRVHLGPEVSRGFEKLPEGWALRATLPAEAYWEYACRAGSDTEYHSGDGDGALRRVGWFHLNLDAGTRPVAQLEPNGFGLYDMHGNVWEWCLDPDAGDVYRGRLDGADAFVPPTDTRKDRQAFRVLRGGSWYSGAPSCRSAFRLGDHPSSRYGNQGFRVCLLPGPGP